MSDIITCPSCRHEFPLTDALTAQLKARFDVEHRSRLEEAVRLAEARAKAELGQQLATLQKLLDEQSAKAREAEALQLEFKRRALELEEGQRQALERARIETEERLRREAEEKIRALVAEAEARARGQSSLELAELRRQLAEQEEKTRQAQARELELARQAEALRQRQQELDVEVERRLAAARTEEEKRLRDLITQEQSLKLAERDKQIADLKRLIEEMRKKSEQGSQELQGEVLEIDIQTALERQFPHDLIRPVPKGMTGADLIQEVRDGALNSCGQIIWEVKNTKLWKPQWLDKLKADQRAARAAIAVLVSVALPEGVRGFAQMNGVWVSDLVHYPMLAVALRDQLQQVAFARAAGQGKKEKMERLYQYLAGDEFRHRVEAIVEAFTALREQLDKERRAMNKHWAEREKQIEQVILNTTGMYGALAGIIGQSLPAIPALELENTPLLKREE